MRLPAVRTEKATRRSFVLSAAATMAAALSGCGGDDPSSPTSPSTPTAPPTLASEVRIPLMPVGATSETAVHLVPGLETPVAVTRLTTTRVVAVSRICTHMQCTVQLPASAGAPLECPCHGSRFRADGQLVNGPAERPLFQFPARIEGDEVVVTANV
jgi:cytochrome b6-f complex iron-sulfur subunit